MDFKTFFIMINYIYIFLFLSLTDNILSIIYIPLQDLLI